MDNILYYGDNLDILRRYVAAESVDLVYLDPPFKSDQNYNVLFQERDGAKAASQIRAFEDTWTWDQEDEGVYAELVTAGGKVADCLEAFRRFLGPCDMLAYLVMMAPRLCELRRVMKPTASIYLHCDPTASHYLKILMDAVFGATNFGNEITWKRTGSHGSAKRWGPLHDVILFYTKTDEPTWNRVLQAIDPDYVESHYSQSDETGPFQLVSLTGAGVRGGDSGAPWRGVNPTEKGRHWAVPLGALRKLVPGDVISGMTTQQKLDLLDTHGVINWPAKGGEPRQKRYLTESQGVPIQDVITDIPPINSQAKERLGYPTQKPVALLERIIQASSNPGALVLDPFCGCGTTIEAAQKLGRRWIGIDITHLAITLMKQRLKDAFGIEPVTLGKGKVGSGRKEEAITSTSTAEMADTTGDYKVKQASSLLQGDDEVTTGKRPVSLGPFRVIGEPVSVPDARDLAASDPYQFQWWALGLVGARPVEQKKGADKGVDGKIVFQGDGAGKFESVILSVKAGHVTANHVRDLRGVVEREKAAIGVLISMEDATGPMRTEAVTAGFYESATWGRKYPKIQLLTVAELLDGREIEMPPRRQVDATFRKAPRARVKPAGSQPELL